MFRFIAIVAMVLAVNAGLAVCPPSAVAADASAFKTAGATRPGDWVRYDRTTTDALGNVERLSVRHETLTNDGRQITSRVTVVNPATGKTDSFVGGRDTTGTIEGSLFEDVRLDANESITRHPPGRETVTVAGRAFDCVVISATASPRRGIVSGLLKGRLSSEVVTESKIWYSPETPFLGMVKKETVGKLVVRGQTQMSFSYRTELAEWGDASHPPAW